MGTNYYHELDVCLHCNRGKDRLHIGKSSAGWCFSLHVYPEDESLPQNLTMWHERFKTPGSRIIDEYGNIVPIGRMISWIRDREKTHTWTEDDLEINGAIRGPNGLARRKCYDTCVGWGEGTYDLCVSNGDHW